MAPFGKTIGAEITSERMREYMECPICGKESERLLALSRKDNKTMICDTCGMMEALEDFEKSCMQSKKELEDKNNG